jgi:beta-galactosidase
VPPALHGDPSACPEDDRRTGYSRREVVQSGLITAAALSLPAVAAPEGLAGTERALSPGVYDLNQGWLFGGRYKNHDERLHHSERGFTRVTLPQTVEPLSWGDWKASAWEHEWIYRRHIDGRGLGGRRVFVDFQGVMTSATVYLNGRRLARHRGGYLPFSIELTGQLAHGDNVLAVIADGRWGDAPPDAGTKQAGDIDFLQPAGIYREVNLRVAPEVMISDVFARPTDVMSGAPGLDVTVSLDARQLPPAGAGGTGSVSVSLQLLDGKTPVAQAAVRHSLLSTGTTMVSLRLAGLNGIALWSPDNPRLYQVTCTLHAAGEAHTAQTRVGFREADFRPDGFYLNGTQLTIFGLNRHQLFPHLGMAASERLQRSDAELLRNQLNCNMVRCSHYPQSQHFLDACDELGLMVWEEVPGWEHVGDASAQQVLLNNVLDMVRRDRNRPSVIAWGTRVDETTGHAGLYRKARRLAYDLDGTRPTTGAMKSYSTANWAEDVFAYNDYHAQDGQAELNPPLPGVPYLVSEAVGSQDGPKLFRWIDSSETLAKQGRMHAEVHDIAQSAETYAGLLAWAAIDYASDHGTARIWHNLKWGGVLDTFRVPKPGAAIYASQVDPSAGAVIVPLFFWDYSPASPAEGPGASAMIATNCDQLDVYVNGLFYAEAVPDRVDFPNLAHPPVILDLMVPGDLQPELRIDGYAGGQLVESLTMSSNPATDRLALTIEAGSIVGDGSDMTRFTFRAVDAYGNQRPYVAGNVSLSCSGPAQLLAQNPFPFGTYGGVGGGVIRSQAGRAGPVSLTLSHPTLGQAAGTVQVTQAPTTPPKRTAGSSPRVINAVVSSAAVIRRALGRMLEPQAPNNRIGAILRRGGYSATFQTPTSGHLTITWHHLRAGNGHRPQRVLVARANVQVRRVGAVNVKIHLTPAGRRLLRSGGSEQITAQASFKPHGKAPVSAVRSFRLPG